MKYKLLFLYTFITIATYSQQKAKNIEIKKEEKSERLIELRKELKNKKNQFPTKKPVYIIAETLYPSLDLKSIGWDTTDIQSIEVLLPNVAIKKYGFKAKNGALVITFGGIVDQVVAGEIKTASNFEPPPEQRVMEKDNIDVPNKIFEKVEIEALFIGSWQRFVESNFKYPDTVVTLGIQGTVNINFIVELDGSINSIKLDDNSSQKNEFLVAETIRVIKKTSGKWKPAQQNGRAVRSIKVQEFNFAIPVD